jgi:hypothetical protein
MIQSLNMESTSFVFFLVGVDSHFLTESLPPFPSFLHGSDGSQFLKSGFLVEGVFLWINMCFNRLVIVVLVIVIVIIIVIVVQ